jgi:DNA polymerase/3'-5' exonuclease PolX
MKMKLLEIKLIAEKYKAMLEPHCKRIEIAGSIRREKPECRDIEIVLIRDEKEVPLFKEIVDGWERVKGDATGRYAQRMLPEAIKIDIFMAQEDNWGNIFLQRTGNWRFSKWMLGTKARNMGYRQREGYLWKDGVKVPCYEEEQIFKLFGMDFISPEDREWE